MTRASIETRPRSTACATYEVGYGRPPAHSRFKPGRSGNPRGRPKGSPNRVPGPHEERFKELILSEAYRPIKVSDNGRTVTIPVAKAFMRSLGMSALKGHARAQKLLAELITSTEGANRAFYDRHVATAIGYKRMARAELDRCRKDGTEPPDLLPHPDDIDINMAEGTVDIKGPMTTEQHEEWEEFASVRDLAADRIPHFEARLGAETDETKRAALIEELDLLRLEHELTTEVIGNWPNNQRP